MIGKSRRQCGLILLFARGREQAFFATIEIEPISATSLSVRVSTGM
jgi:hypothetical protein